jgi:hypothetical protein
MPDLAGRQSDHCARRSIRQGKLNAVGRSQLSVYINDRAYIARENSFVGDVSHRNHSFQQLKSIHVPPPLPKVQV